MRLASLLLVLLSGAALAQGDLAARRDALQSAIVKRDTARVSAFIRSGMDLNFNFDDLLPRQRTGESPLTLSLHRRFADITKLLLEGGADAGRIDGFGERPIHAARSPEAAALLVAAGADANALNYRGWTALSEAVQRGELATVDALLASGARADVQGKATDLLTVAAESRRGELIGALLERGVDPKSPPTQVLWPLIESGDTERAKLVIARGADPSARNSRGESLVARALFRSRWEIAEALVAAGAQLDGSDRMQIARLASFDPESLRRLRTRGADLSAADASGHTAITSLIIEQPMAIRAVRGGAAVGVAVNAATGQQVTRMSAPRPTVAEIPAPDNVARVKALLGAGADANAKYRDLTPLMLAIGVRAQGRDFTGVLLDAGGRVEFDALIPKPAAEHPSMPIGTGPATVAGYSGVDFNERGVHTGMRVGPLGWAVVHGGGDVAVKLLERDRKVDPEDVNLLYFAARFGQWDVLASALPYTREVNAADRADVTPLMLAADAGRADAVRALLAAGARVNARSARSWPPLLERDWKNEIGGAIAGHSPPPPRLVGGYTALRAAKWGGHAEAARVLEAAGGRE